ncbi:MAG: hypothetical protein WB791_01335 [Waddliaceae bacterium]
MTSILFLFGAGASKGSEKKGINVPACGAGLFEELKRFAPSTWGKLDPPYGTQFRDDFEKGMKQVIENHSRDVLGLQQDMAKYFFNFFPSSKSLYIQLIKRIGFKGITFASLNYDWLLEQAFHVLEIPMKEIDLCLPHGCSNRFVKGIKGPQGSFSFGCANHLIDGPIVSVCSQEDFNERVKPLHPVMACVDPQKKSPIGKAFLADEKNKFEKSAFFAKVIVIIGVQVREHDNHIWTPLEKTDAKIVYCSGSGNESFKSWAEKSRAGKNDECLPGYFLDNFGNICKIAEDALANYRGYSQNNCIMI